MKEITSTTIIVRECGERTADICYQLLSQQFSHKSVFRISEKPFSRALRKSFQIGISENRDYILCIDADVIPIGKELISLIEEMDQLPKHIPEIQAMIFDNLFRVLRPAGNHLYRTSFAKQAMQLIPKEGTSLRPESDMLSALIRKGHPWKQSLKLVGYHDFEQSYEDIYRKAFLHTKKHSEFLNYLNSLWKNLSDTSTDFKVAVAAMEDGDKFQGVVQVDKSFLMNEITKRLTDLGVEEKERLSKNYVLPEVDQIINSLDASIKDARDQCESALHKMIFSSRSAKIRQLLSHRYFQGIFS